MVVGACVSPWGRFAHDNNHSASAARGPYFCPIFSSHVDYRILNLETHELYDHGDWSGDATAEG